MQRVRAERDRRRAGIVEFTGRRRAVGDGVTANDQNVAVGQPRGGSGARDVEGAGVIPFPRGGGATIRQGDDETNDEE